MTIQSVKIVGLNPTLLVRRPPKNGPLARRPRFPKATRAEKKAAIVAFAENSREAPLRPNTSLLLRGVTVQSVKVLSLEFVGSGSKETQPKLNA